MKNIYTVFILLLVLASCSEWKYTKGIKWKQTEYQASKAKVSDPAEERTTALNDEPAAENAQPATSEETPARTEIEEEKTTSESISEEAEEVTILVRDEDDSLEVVSPEVVRMAFDAEDQARKSRNLGIVGLIMTLTYIFAFVGLILSIIGLIKGINSMRSRYNTPKGVSMARTGIITSSIIIGLYVLAIIVILTALFLML